MVEILSTTPAGHIDPLEAASVGIYGYERAMQRRETARVRRPSKRDEHVHLDVYPGDAPADERGTIVYVHGLSSHALSYADFADRLAERGWNVVGFDTRGHGRSSGPRGDFTMEGLLEDAKVSIDYAAERFGGPIAIFGTSLGGFYALAISNALPDVAAACCHWVMLPELPVTAKDRRMRPIARVLSKFLPRFRMNTLKVAEWDHVNDTAELRQKLYDDPLMSFKYTTRALASGILYSPARPLTDLRVPTRVIIGDRDKMTPLEYTREVYSRMQGEKDLVVIPDAGHMGGLVEHQGEVLDAVDEFMKAHIATSSRVAATS